MNSCLGVRADEDGCASGQPTGGISVRAGRSRRGAPAFVNVYGRARQHAGALDGGPRQAVQRQDRKSLPICDSIATRWIGRFWASGDSEFVEPWIDLEEDKTARAVAFGLLAETGSGIGAPRQADIQHFGSANSTA